MQDRALVNVLAGLAARLGDPGHALGDLARHAIARDGALSIQMADWALATTARRLTVPALVRRTTATDLTNRHVAVILGRSVPTAALRAVVLPLLRGARRLTVRSARGQSEFPSLLIETFAREGLPVERCSDGSAQAALAEAIASGADYVIAYGDDDTLEAIRNSLPPHVTLEGRGHGLGVSLVFSGRAIDPQVARAVALDVAHYDQLGCLSPRWVLFQGNATSAAEFAAALSKALDHLGAELPRGPLGPDLAAQVVQWQGAMAAGAEVFYRGAHHAVALIASRPLPGTPGARNIAVVPIETSAGLATALAPLVPYLTCVGVASLSSRLADVSAACTGGAPRIVEAGCMQDPPLDGYEDPRPPKIYGNTATDPIIS